MAKSDPAADAAKLKTLGAILVKLRELQAQTYELADEMNKILTGGVGVAAECQLLERDFNTIWQARYGPAPYVFTQVKDRPQMKRLLKMLTPEEIIERMGIYLKNEDKFFLNARHGFGLFVSTINQHAPASRTTAETPIFAPFECPHTPRCGNRSTCAIVAARLLEQQPF